MHDSYRGCVTVLPDSTASKQIVYNTALNVIRLCSILNLIFTCGLYNFLSDFTFMFRSYLWFLL